MYIGTQFIVTLLRANHLNLCYFTYMCRLLNEQWNIIRGTFYPRDGWNEDGVTWTHWSEIYCNVRPQFHMCYERRSDHLLVLSSFGDVLKDRAGHQKRSPQWRFLACLLEERWWIAHALTLKLFI